MRASPSGPYELGFRAFSRGEYLTASVELDHALAAEPDDDDAAYYLGLSLAELGRHAAAANALRLVVQRRPRDAHAHLHLAESLAEEGEYFAARCALREALRLDPRITRTRRSRCDAPWWDHIVSLEEEAADGTAPRSLRSGACRPACGGKEARRTARRGSSRRFLARLCWPLAVLSSLACLDDGGAVAPSPPPAILGATVEPSAHMASAALVSVHAVDADSIVVSIAHVGAGTAAETAPPVPVREGLAVVPVLGLLPDTRYLLRPIARGRGGETTGAPLDLTTGPLPVDLPAYAAGGPDPTPGYVVFAAGRYGLVIDNDGRVVWYRRFPNGPGLAFLAQPNGHYFARPPTPEAGDIEPWLELDPLGEIVRSVTCAHGLQPRFHDLIAEPDGTYWLLCDETRTLDLTAHGGQPEARVTAQTVQHIAADGTVLIEWSPFDHFAIVDVDESERTGASVNWTHANSLDRTPEGDLLVSFRNLGEITRIDGRTGDVIWRLGGRRNQFAFTGTDAPAFSRQHSVRAVSGGLVILDNVGDPGESRAEHYAVDGNARTATLIGSFGATPPALTLIGGSVQRLPGDRTLVSFGTAGRVEEVDAAGRTVWRIEGDAGYVFRAQRIRSLYTPGAGSTR